MSEGVRRFSRSENEFIREYLLECERVGGVPDLVFLCGLFGVGLDAMRPKVRSFGYCRERGFFCMVSRVRDEEYMRRHRESLGGEENEEVSGC